MRIVTAALLGVALSGQALAADPGADTGAETRAGTGSETPLAGDPEAGAKLYKQFCRGCHGADGRGGAHTFMPHVDRLTRKGYIDLLPDEHLIAVITEGGEPFGMSSYMPAWGVSLTEDEIRDIVAHIRTLPLY